MAEQNRNTQYVLQIENELRIVVGKESSTIQLVTGLAEIFGTEMKLNEKYKLQPHSSIAVYTWHGCTIQVTGKTEEAHVVADTLMILNVILHASIEQHRIKAEAENARGPVVLVVGPTDVGKSTLCRILLNYAARLGRKPVFVDLDVGQNAISVPGSMGFLDVKKPADISQGFDDEDANVYHFGYKSPGHKIPLYFRLLRQLGLDVRSHINNERQNAISSGVVINSCGWVTGHGYNAINFAAMVFEIDILCVLGEEQLYFQLLNDIPSSVQVHYIPKMCGVVERSRPLRQKTRESRISDYFYGPTNNLSPSTFEVIFSEIHVFRVKSKRLTVDFNSANAAMDKIDVVPVTLSEQLVNQVLGLSSAESVVEDMLMKVVGFVRVKNIDIGRGVITVLAPQPSPLPSKILLLGNISVSEQI